MKSYRKALLVVLLLVATVLGLYFAGMLEETARLFLDPEYLRDVIGPYGFYAAFILIFLLLVNNILWIIPGHGLGVACGLIFGPFWGVLVCFIGTTLSTVVAMMISKRYGRPFARKMFGDEQFEKYENLASSHDIYPFVVLTIVPVVPDDMLVYLAGLTDMSKKKIVVALSLARLPGVVALVAFGEGIARSDPALSGVIAGIIGAAVLISLWKIDKINEMVHRYEG